MPHVDLDLGTPRRVFRMGRELDFSSPGMGARRVRHEQ